MTYIYFLGFSQIVFDCVPFASDRNNEERQDKVHTWQMAKHKAHITYAISLKWSSQK